MSDEYDGLDGPIDQVVEQAVYSELKLYAWHPDGSGNVTYVPAGRRQPRAGLRGAPDDAADGEGDVDLQNLEKHVEEAPASRSNGTQDQESFRFDRPSGTYSADETSDFVYPGVVVNSRNVRDAARMLDKDIAPEMNAAASSLGEGDAAYQWWRDDSSVGVGSWGCYSDYSAASYALQKEIEETAKEMGWAAEMLRAVADDLNTDNDVSDDFGGVRKKIDGYDNPAPVPAPSYPPGHVRPEH